MSLVIESLLSQRQNELNKENVCNFFLLTKDGTVIENGSLPEARAIEGENACIFLIF